MAFKDIPGAIREKDRWLYYDEESANAVIYSPKNKKEIASTEMTVLAGFKPPDNISDVAGSFGDAEEIVNNNRFCKLGYVLDEAEYGIVVYNAYKPNSHKPEGWADKLIGIIGSYAESMASDKILILFKYDGNMSDNFKAALDAHTVEIRGHGEFIPMTGNVIAHAGELKDCTYRQKLLTNLPLDSLVEFSQQPFKPYADAELDKLAESIKTHGVMEPILVRPLPSKGRKGKKKQFQIISGHNRVLACRKLGMTEIHGIIEQMDDDTATLKMVDANLKQRQGLLISERAMAYKLVFDTLKKPGHRYDLDENGQPRDNFVARSIRASDVIGSEENKSGRTVERLVRLTELIPEFLSDVDARRLGTTTAEVISHLSKDEQKELYSLLKDKNIAITLKQAKALKDAMNDYEPLDRNRMFEILEEAKPVEPVKRTPIRVPCDSIAQFFEDENMSDEDINKTIIEALRLYRENR